MNFIKQKFLGLVSAIIQVIQHWKAPWVKKIMTGDQLQEIIDTAVAGDVLVVRAGGYFSTFMFSLFGIGRFTHCVYVNAKGKITDSTRVGVEKRPMLSTLVGYTDAAILRPKLSSFQKEQANKTYKALMKKDAKTGIAYNWNLVEPSTKDPDGKELPDELTCAQFIRLIMNAGSKDYIELRPRFGFQSVTPQDYYDAKSKFDVIAEYK